MASKKKHSEGIALLSMYNDEEDEDDEMEEDIPQDSPITEMEQDLQNSNKFPSDSISESTSTLLQSQNSQNSIPMEEDSTQEEEDKKLTPTPIHLQIPVTSPPLNSDVQRIKKRSLAIVDYAHDETAMSPEAEDHGRAVFDEDNETANDNIQRVSPSVATQTPNIDGTPQLSERPERLQSDSSATMTVYMESETTVVEESVTISVEIKKDVDPLDNFLPPPSNTMCSEELQEKINKFLKFKKLGRSFNDEVRNRKDYRNPDFLLHAVRYQDIDQIGSCFSKDVFDPHGYDKSDFYDEIEADMKREMDRKEQERKKSQRIDYVPGGTQAAQRNNIQNPVVPTLASSGFQSHPPPADSIPRSDRHNKKSKWDKVDGDRKHQDGLSAAHAALLSATSVGAGYTAFAQQRRREAEEKRSSDRRRS